jgi:hypothetical protein
LYEVRRPQPAVTVIAIPFYFHTGMRAAEARGKYGVPVPAVSGYPGCVLPMQPNARMDVELPAVAPCAG